MADENQFFSSVPILPGSSNCLFFSRNQGFAEKLLSNKAVLEEIIALNSAFSYPQIWFEAGQFQMFLQGRQGLELGGENPNSLPRSNGFS